MKLNIFSIALMAFSAYLLAVQILMIVIVTMVDFQFN